MNVELSEKQTELNADDYASGIGRGVLRGIAAGTAMLGVVVLKEWGEYRSAMGGLDKVFGSERSQLRPGFFKKLWEHTKDAFKSKWVLGLVGGAAVFTAAVSSVRNIKKAREEKEQAQSPAPVEIANAEERGTPQNETAPNFTEQLAKQDCNRVPYRG